MSIEWGDGSRHSPATLGRSVLRVPWLGFGGAPIGNLGTAVSAADAEAAVHAAWHRGIRYFDVSPHYGIGLAEERLGRALRAYPRDEFVLSTKVGRLLVDTARPPVADAEGFAVSSAVTRVFDYSAEGARRSVSESLHRLGLDRIDIAFVHDLESHYAEAVDGAFVALDALRREGTIASYGPASNEAPVLESSIRDTDSDIVLSARTWTLADTSAGDRVLPLARERGVSVVVGGVFTRLTDGRLRRDEPDRFAAIDEICREYGVPMAAAAIRFPLVHPAVDSVLIGMRDAAEVARDVAAAAHEIPHGFWVDLRARLGLRET